MAIGWHFCNYLDIKINAVDGYISSPYFATTTMPIRDSDWIQKFGIEHKIEIVQEKCQNDIFFIMTMKITRQLNLKYPKWALQQL